ncbi:TolC family protein [Komagataeibacter oboediens]|uniref:TolC family protein n=1 Tax=Komagataeibacter oboediens TaxID=65958 RepID=UPI001C2BD6A9|nr:TolC family protein [Komagataeibacter oboediens]MBV0886977.1 TolC family protein [Komagataeibacter oboediens]MCK9820471.1 TolC family protein [Komagataeibacter oboediens]
MRNRLARVACMGGVAMAVGLAGCSPFHTRTPASHVVVPGQFSQAPASTIPATDLTRWWEAWHDPALVQAVDAALAASPDIRIARDRVREARAMHTVAKSALYPTVGATGNMMGGGMYWRNPSALPTSGDPGTDGHLAGIGASWEPDLFGGRHADVKAAKAGMQAEEEYFHGVQMVIAADAASDYLQAQGVQRQIALTDRSISMLEQLRRYAQARFTAGQATAADVTGVDQKLSDLKARRPVLVAQLDLVRRRLAVLSGQVPEELPALTPPPTYYVPPAPAGQMPDTVLERRPDIRARRDQVDAALNRLKSAKTDLLPRFGLEFFGGDGRLRFDGIPGLSGTGGLIALTTYLPIFTANRIQARIHAASARLDAAVAGYDNSILHALAEVEDGYENRLSLDGRDTDLTRAQHQAEQVARDMMGLYTGGQRTFGDVLSARMTALDAQASVLSNQDARTTATIQLARALGGGWQQEGVEVRK